MNKERMQISISWGTFWRLIFMAAVAGVLFLSIDVLLAVFVGIVISSALDPFVSFLSRLKIPRVLGTLLVFIGILLIFAGAIYSITPVLIEELHAFLEQFFPLVARWVNFDPNKLSSIFDLSLEKIAEFVPLGRGGEVLQFSQSVIGNITLLLAVFAISFYLLVDHKGVERFLREILPDQYESPIAEIFLRARQKMGYWLQAQIIMSFFIGVTVAVGLYILGVEHALLLGIIAGIFEIVPFVGPVLTGTIAVLVAMSQSFQLGIYTIILFVLIQQVENNLLVPVFMKRAVGLHPVAILISLLLGANLFGFVGIILAVPLTVFAQEFIDDWALRKAALREGRASVE